MGMFSVAYPLKGATRALLSLPPQGAQPLQAIAMYGAPCRVALFARDLSDLSMAVFDLSIFSDFGIAKLGPVGDRSLRSTCTS